MIILWKEYASKPGASGMMKVKISSKFFLNLEKSNGTQSQICKIIVNDQEITDPNKIKNKIKNFDKSLFKKRNSKLDNIPLPKVNIAEIIECNNELSEKKLYCP